MFESPSAFEPPSEQKKKIPTCIKKNGKREAPLAEAWPKPTLSKGKTGQPGGKTPLAYYRMTTTIGKVESDR